MRTNFLFLCALLAGVAFLSSCQKDLRQTEVTLTLNLPEGLSDVKFTHVGVIFTELNTNRRTTEFALSGNTVSALLDEGTYTVTAHGCVSYKIDTDEYEINVQGILESQVFVGATHTAAIDLGVVQKKSDFVIQEIYFTGGVTDPDRRQYNGDKFVKLYNNTDQVLYADGLVIGTTQFLTTDKYDYSPDIMSEAVATDALIQIPGSGQQYPVQPGESLLIADNAIDHREFNSRSIDLTIANFEWYDENLGGEVDNPEVPNMFNLYSRMLGHNRGFKSWFLARIPVSNEEYLTDYVYDYTYDFINAGTVYPMARSAYKVPNEWIIDAVNLSVATEFQWLVMSSTLDMGWTHCGSVNSDPERYEKSVIRKVLTTLPDGRVILQDTNNSAVDFIPDSPVSLLAQ